MPAKKKPARKPKKETIEDEQISFMKSQVNSFAINFVDGTTIAFTRPGNTAMGFNRDGSICHDETCDPIGGSYESGGEFADRKRP